VPPPHPARIRLAALLAIGLALVGSSCTSGAVTDRTLPTGTPRPSFAPGTPTSPAPTTPSRATATPVLKPAIVSKPIPFPESRKEEMAAYAERHYGIDTYVLHDPRAVVEHVTATNSFQVVWNTFASNAPDLGELPGTCAHFVIDDDGTIYQLVPLDVMCRHTSGMNWTAVGIEMVGLSDQQILENPRQLDAALDLTLWLMARFGIELRNVIGHNENLTSPLRIEKVESFRCQTHGDWTHADMEVFREKLADLAKRYAVPLGPITQPVDIGC
jgi:N-acetylmuramoyl-L-alanine amidase